MRTRRLFLALVAVFILGLPVAAQQSGNAASAPAAPAPAVPAANAANATSAANPVELPDTYRSVTLGMDLEAVKTELLADSLFGYRGERDVSLLPGENRSLIETSGPSFIRRAWFQFSDSKLYIMTFNLDPSKVDYYSLYSTLVKKYGEPAVLDPHKAVWAGEKVTLSLERPLTVKYVENEVFNGILEGSKAEKAITDVQRENFLNGF
jgi:hypothetical protein